jgi:hypothetical protein
LGSFDSLRYWALYAPHVMIKNTQTLRTGNFPHGFNRSTQ